MNTTPPTSSFQFGNKLYDKLKFTVQIMIPGLGVLYASLAQYWDFPNVQGVVGTLAAVALFLGLLLGLSSKNFNPPPPTGTPVGNFVVTESADGMKSVNLEFDRDPNEFIGNDNITFRSVEQEAASDKEFRDENLS